MLDKYLQKGWYSGSELREYCNKALEEVGFSPVTSRQTLANDIAHIEVLAEPKVPGALPPCPASSTTTNLPPSVAASIVKTQLKTHTSNN